MVLKQVWNAIVQQEGYEKNGKIFVRKEAAERMLAGLGSDYEYSPYQQICPQEVSEENFYKLFKHK